MADASVLASSEFQRSIGELTLSTRHHEIHETARKWRETHESKLDLFRGFAQAPIGFRTFRG
jgi:hypothetical protein